MGMFSVLLSRGTWSQRIQTLRKPNFSAVKIDFFFSKLFDFFNIYVQNNVGGSDEYTQSMFWKNVKKNRILLHTPVSLYN